MKKLISFLSMGYAIYALLVVWFAGRTCLQVYHAYSAQPTPLSPVQWVPLGVLILISSAFIGMFLCLAYFLSTRRRRHAALIIAGISCLAIPVGTILGGLTIYALTRPEIILEFTSTA